MKPQDVFGTSAKTVYNKPLMHLQDRKPVGDNSQPLLTGQNVRVINTQVTNEIPGASWVNSTFTLPAGVYDIEAMVASYGTTAVASGQSSLRRKSDGAVLVLGINALGYYSVTQSVSGQITLTETTELQIWTYQTQTNTQTALSSNSGDGEIYLDIKIRKMDSDVSTRVISDPTMALKAPLFHAQERYVNGDGAGSSISGWQTRNIRYERVNEIPGCTIANNQITLPAGTYRIKAQAPGSNVGMSRLVIRNVTTDTVIMAGMNAGYDRTANMYCQCDQQKTLTEETVIDVRHYTATATTTTGLGAPVSDGSDEIYAEIMIWQLDVVVETPVLVSDRLFPLPGGVIVTGNMHGFDYSKTSPNNITVEAGICMDSLNTAMLTLVNPQLIAIPTTASTAQNLFICDDGVVRLDTDAAGPGLGAYKIRWIGYVKTDTAGEIVPFTQRDDEMQFSKASANPVSSPSTSYQLLDLTAHMPSSRIKSVLFGGNSSANVTFAFSYDGINVDAALHVIAGQTDTGDLAWARYDGPSHLTYNGTMYVKTSATGTQSLLMHAVKMRR